MCKLSGEIGQAMADAGIHVVETGRGDRSLSAGRLGRMSFSRSVCTLFALACMAMTWMQCTDNTATKKSHSATKESRVEVAAGLPARVGSQACQSCHRQLHTAYHKTVAMARSFYPMTPAAEVENWQEGNTFHHARSGLFYKMERRGDRYYQRRWRLDLDGLPSHEFEREITHVMGSGNNVRTYVNYTTDGKATQLPVSWYAETETWAMSPGYDQEQHSDFHRGIDHGCMFCHNAYPSVPEVDATGTTYLGALPAGIDCERCHGPGGDHVDLAEGDTATLEDIREAIVNPARLDAKRAMDICLQCHLETAVNSGLPHSLRRFDRKIFSFQPGEALEDFLLPFDSPELDEDRFEIAHHGYRLMQSKCFQASDGGMTCTTCHDPHATPDPANVQQHFRERCSQCHKRDDCSAEHMAPDGQKPAIAKEDCITCHMPKRRAIDVVHAVMRDHRIVRHLPERDVTAPLEESQEIYQGDLTFFLPQTAPKGAEGDLYLGTAYLQGGVHVQRGIDLIEKAIANGAPPAATSYRMVGLAKVKQKDYAGALVAFEKAVALQPTDVTSRSEMGAVLLVMGREEEADKQFQMVLATTPDHPDTLVGLARIAGKKSDRAAVRRLLERAVVAAPDHPQVRSVLARHLLSVGDRDGAREHFEQILRLSPKDTDALLQLGWLSHGVKDWRRALLHAREVLALDGNHRQAAMLAATVYSTAPDPTLRDGPVALELMQRCLRGQQSIGPAVQLIAAAAHAECGDFAAAIRLAETSWRIAQSSNNAQLLQQCSARLEAYRSNTAWHEPE